VCETRYAERARFPLAHLTGAGVGSANCLDGDTDALRVKLEESVRRPDETGSLEGVDGTAAAREPTPAEVVRHLGRGDRARRFLTQLRHGSIEHMSLVALTVNGRQERSRYSGPWQAAIVAILCVLTLGACSRRDAPKPEIKGYLVPWTPRVVNEKPISIEAIAIPESLAMSFLSKRQTNTDSGHDWPPGTTPTRSDASGSFSLRLPDDGRVLLFARSNGIIDEDGRECEWLVWVTPLSGTPTPVSLTEFNRLGMAHQPVEADVARTTENDESNWFLNLFTGFGSLVSALVALLLIAISLVLYFLPVLVARRAGHHNTTAIFVLNLLLGWTVLGWVVALVWAFMRRPDA
jgi:hypothetical protein